MDAHRCPSVKRATKKACRTARRKNEGSSVSISRVLFLLRHCCRRSLLPFIYYASRPASPAFYPPPPLRSDGTPSSGGIHELAAPRWYSPMIAHRLVVSYTTFSPLPRTMARRLFSSTDTCRRRQLLLSEVGFPVLPGLSSPAPTHSSGRTETLFPTVCKVTAILRTRQNNCPFIFSLYGFSSETMPLTQLKN